MKFGCKIEHKEVKIRFNFILIYESKDLEFFMVRINFERMVKYRVSKFV